MRATSSTRASPRTSRTSLVATPPRSFFDTASWRSARAAICGRCVMTSA
jgi:hypothetical protein